MLVLFFTCKHAKMYLKVKTKNLLFFINQAVCVEGVKWTDMHRLAGGHAEGPPGLLLHAPQPGTPAGH